MVSLRDRRIGSSFELKLDTSGKVAFTHLRRLARRNDLVIREPGARYVDRDELAVLNWLAQAQRVAGLKPFAHPDEQLRDAVVKCGQILTEIDLRLPVRSAKAGHFAGDTVRLPIQPPEQARTLMTR